jgi:hypothetical protein
LICRSSIRASALAIGSGDTIGCFQFSRGRRSWNGSKTRSGWSTNTWRISRMVSGCTLALVLARISICVWKPRRHFRLNYHPVPIVRSTVFPTPSLISFTFQVDRLLRRWRQLHPRRNPGGPSATPGGFLMPVSAKIWMPPVRRASSEVPGNDPRDVWPRC